jgi:glycerol-3-phosphate acyltransferase PlsY
MSAYDPVIRAAVLIGYLCGSIPFGLIFTRMAGLGDIRSIGSGNIGATNVLRTGNRWLALATLLADCLKAVIPIVLARLYFGDGAAVATGLGAFVGHVFPVWLRFKGGKGVATYIGVLFGLYWPAGIAFCLIWLAVAIVFKVSSLAALSASTVVAIGALILSVTLTTDGSAPSAAPDLKLGVVFSVLGALIFFTHRANLQRLVAGTEPRIGAGKTTPKNASPL